MPREINGQLDGKGLRIALCATRFNSNVVERLIEGAVDCLVRHGVADADITVIRCPGAWELPLVCDRVARAGKHQAIVALGCIIRGDTPHFDYVAAECTKGIASVAMATRVPVILGVLTTDTPEQALARAGLKHGNKGFEAALAAIEMCTLGAML